MSQIKSPSARSAALEHAGEQTRREAEQCLTKAGSAEQGQRAVDSATGHPATTKPQNDAFAKRWGFASYLEMFEASKPLRLLAGKNWLVTHIGGDQWIIWNDQDLEVVQTVKSFQVAQNHIIDTVIRDRPRDSNPPPTG